MARKRMIDPEFWLDEEISELNPYARLLYIGLWGICDDNYATLPNKVKWIKAQVFPYNDGVDIEGHIKDLIKIGKLVPFLVNGEEFLFIKNFFKYQRIDRPSKAKYPQYQATKGDTRRILDEPSTNTRTEVKLSKDKLSKVKAINIPPRVQAVLKELGDEKFIPTQRTIDLIENDFGSYIIEPSIKLLADYNESHNRSVSTNSIRNWLQNAKKFGQLERREK